MQSGIPAERIYYQLYGIEDNGIASFSPVTSPQDGSDSFSQSEILDGRGVNTEFKYSPVTSSQENSSTIKANSKHVKDTGSEVKVYDFSKLLEN